MKKKNTLVIIDPQPDFCEGGALAVTGGNAALSAVANVIKNNIRFWDDIVITLDQHHRLHIGNTTFCVDAQGRHPDPFTVLIERNGQLINGTLDAKGAVQEIGQVYCSVASLTKWTIDYVRSLEAEGRYRHMFWPPHCLIGSPGACIHPEVFEAMIAWETERNDIAQKVTKGSNYKTEHFGAVRAEVIDPSDSTTDVNFSFIASLENPEQQNYVTGLARGHCLANTMRDAAVQLGNDRFYQRLTLLSDCTADVAGLQFLGDNFQNAATAAGMRVMQSTDL